MTLTLNLPPDILDRLAEKAKAQGVDVTDIAERALAREAGPAAGEMPVPPKEAAARAAVLGELFAQWDEEDKDVDPAEAERELEDFMQSLNENRRLTGERPVYEKSPVA